MDTTIPKKTVQASQLRAGDEVELDMGFGTPMMEFCTVVALGVVQGFIRPTVRRYTGEIIRTHDFHPTDKVDIRLTPLGAAIVATKVKNPVHRSGHSPTKPCPHCGGIFTSLGFIRHIDHCKKRRKETTPDTEAPASDYLTTERMEIQLPPGRVPLNKWLLAITSIVADAKSQVLAKSTQSSRDLTRPVIVTEPYGHDGAVRYFVEWTRPMTADEVAAESLSKSKKRLSTLKKQQNLIAALVATLGDSPKSAELKSQLKSFSGEQS